MTNSSIFAAHLFQIHCHLLSSEPAVPKSVVSCHLLFSQPAFSQVRCPKFSSYLRSRLIPSLLIILQFLQPAFSQVRCPKIPSYLRSPPSPKSIVPPPIFAPLLFPTLLSQIVFLSSTRMFPSPLSQIHLLSSQSALSQVRSASVSQIHLQSSQSASSQVPLFQYHLHPIFAAGSVPSPLF